MRRASIVRQSLRGNQLSSEQEIFLMQIEENEQTQVDRFWGFDKEATDRAYEIAQMNIESLLSRKYQDYCKFQEQKKIWEKKFEMHKLESAYVSAVNEDKERQNYMSTFFSVSSSDEIMDFTWRTKPHVQSDTNYQNHALKSPYRKQAIKKPLERHSMYPLPSEDESRMLSLQLDGLQVSRALVGASIDQLGPPLRNRSSSTVASLEPEPVVENKKNMSNNENTKAASFGIATSSRRIKLLNSSLSDEILANIKYSPETEHIRTLDGHHMYKWDQELILRVAYSKLCTSSSGYVSLNDMKNISHSLEVHELLQYTVFSSKIKWKKWTFFSDIFQGKSRIGLNSWINAARAIAKERLHAKHVRTEGEHRSVVLDFESGLAGLTSWTEHSRDVNGYPTGWFASLARKSINLRERECQLLRDLCIGETCWGLHDKGVVWLPAVVENIYYDEITGEVSYGLIFPLTQRSLQQARTHATSRKLVSPTSDDVVNSNLGKTPTERQLCYQVFDMIDIRKIGQISIQELSIALRSAAFSYNVKQSAALSALVYGRGEVYMDTMPPFESSLNALYGENSVINKFEFAETAMTMLDFLSYKHCIKIGE